ncbi:MAG: hypothetical protein EOP53_22670 [Sphingobacteriales bacterium]|nr:MAG: hypothetical protein EOP53_22670 [Sphingobacteriales bacterium]
MNIYKHDQGAYFPMALQIIASVIGIGGFSIVLNYPLISVFLIPLALFVVFCRNGIEVDFNETKYRDYWGPTVLRFGKWISLPEIDYISVFKTKISQTVSSRVSSVNFEDEEIQVNLITADRKRITVFETKNKNHALARAWKFADQLKVGILDATTHEREWIKE